MTTLIPRLDAHLEIDRICDVMRSSLTGCLKRRGVVVAMSGGVDSSVCAALAARSLGPNRVLGLMMPERESDPESLSLATSYASQLGIPHEIEDITALLEGAQCYSRRDEAARRAVPAYGSGWRCKLVLAGGGIEPGRLHLSLLIVQDPSGLQYPVRLDAQAYRGVVAATSFKQRARAMIAYYHADRLHYGVVGTPNRVEYDQGFFVKGGDGLADLKPIAHLYKSQVLALAEALGVPQSIRARKPTSDTFPLPQTQEEFFFGLGVPLVDELVAACTDGRDSSEVAGALGLTVAQVEQAWAHVEQKRASARYLHLPPLLVEPVELPTLRDFQGVC